MNYLIFIVIILSVLNCKYRNEKIAEFLSVGQTTAINGIFVMLVFLSHFKQYITFEENDMIYVWVSQRLGQLIVTTFLLYSGYGVMYSLMHKPNYIDTLPKRFLKLLLHFDLAVLLYVLVDLVIGKELTIPQILLSLVCWDSVGNSNWYILAILSMYLLSYVVGKIIPQKYFTMTVFVTLGCFVYIVLLRIGGKPLYTYDTIFCFPAGMLLAIYKNRIVEWFLNPKNRVISFILFLCSWLICHKGMGVADNPMIHFVFLEMNSVLFAIAIVTMSTLLIIENPIISFCGKYVFEIYILQRIPMNIFQGIIKQKLFYFLVCLIVTILLTLVFRQLEQTIDKKLLGRCN